MKFKSFLIFILLSSAVSAQNSSIYDIARKGTVEELKKFLQNYPASLDSPNEKGYYPLTIACYHGNKKVAVYLANNVKDINCNGDYGTPLMAAVFRGHADLVNALLKLGANPNITDANGTTNLHYAVILDNEPIVKELLDFGADPKIKDKKGRLPLDYAKISDNKTILELLSHRNN